MPPMNRPRDFAKFVFCAQLPLRAMAEFATMWSKWTLIRSGVHAYFVLQKGDFFAIYSNKSGLCVEIAHDKMEVVG